MSRCKMMCSRTGQSSYGSRVSYDAQFLVVTGGSDDGKFFEATPAGDLKLQCLVGQFFEAGKEYYIDITPVIRKEPTETGLDRLRGETSNFIA